MRHIHLLLVLLFPVVQAIAQPMQVLHKSYAEKSAYLQQLNGQYYNNRRAYDDTLTAYENLALKNNDAELASMFRLRRYHNQIDDLHTGDIEKNLLSLEETAAAKKMNLLLADIYQELGHYYNVIGHNYNLSLEYYLKAYSIYSRADAGTFPMKQRYTYGLILEFYLYGDYENVIRYSHEAFPLPSYNSNTEFFFPVNNLLGLSYRSLQRFDSSDKYFRAMLDTAEKYHADEWVTISSGNIGINDFYQHRYDEAIPLLKRDIDTSLAKNQNVKNAVNSLWILATIYLEQNNTAEARAMATLAVAKGNEQKWWYDPKLAAHLYALLHRLYEQEGNYKLSTAYADSEIRANDSEMAHNTLLTNEHAREKIDYVRHTNEIEKLQGQKVTHMLVDGFLTAIILLLLFIGLLLINRQKVRQIKLETETKTARRTLEEFRKNIYDKNQMIEQVTTEMERLRHEEQVEANTELIVQLERSILLTDEQWEEFRRTFEKVHKGFFVRLREKIPDLSPADTRIMALSKLNLSNKEMAGMLGISPNAVRMNKHRLRKKLGVEEENDFHTVLATI